MEKDTNIVKPYLSLFTKTKKLFFSNRNRTILTISIMLTLVFLVWQLSGRGKKQPQYQTAIVTKGTIISTVNESGNVTSNSQAGVGSPTTGIVTDIYVKDGDTVTQGQNLFKVKSIATAQEVASALSSYQNAIVSANTAMQNKITNQSKLEQDRQAVLDNQGAVDRMNSNIGGNINNPKTGSPYTQNEINSINSTLTSAREIFSADEQKFKQSDENIAAANDAENSAWLSYQATQDSVITAPIGGTVANIVVKTGDQVTANGGNLSSNISSTTSSSSNTAILYVGNYSAPYIKVQASEVDIINIKQGQKATTTLSAFPNKTFVGTVYQVDTAGTISSGVVTYNVFVTFVAPPSNIKPGMSAAVTIQAARKDDVLTVPSLSIQTSNQQTTVRVLQDGKITSVPVETGIASDTDTEITSGLSEGETIVTGIISTGTTQTTGASPFSGIRGFGVFGGGRGGGRGG